MQLPNAELATIPPEKITEYLLNPTHPRASGKAAFFRRFGFSKPQAEAFAAALLTHARINPVASSRPARDGRGVNYAIVGPLPTPDGRNPRVCAIWFVAENQKPLAWSPLMAHSAAMLKEHDSVVLTTDVAEDGLKAGDVGVIVLVHQDGKAFEVEFMTLAGETIAVTSLSAAQVRPVGKQDITHVRTLSVA